MHRRSFLLGAGAVAVMPSAACGQARVRSFRPEDFGARGDGRSDDTGAFAAMAAAVARAGGGEVVLRRATYRVGRQGPGGGAEWAYQPAPVLSFDGLAGPLAIRGEGARLLAAAALRYGTWDRRTGRAVRRAMPNYQRGEWASPYRAMVHVARVRGAVEIEGLELDGNLPGLQLGGPWGDTGHQIPAFGLFLEDNAGGEIVRDVRSRRHGQDGIIVAASARRNTRTRLERVACEENGRQGVSIVSGRGFDVVDCAFTRTGRGALASSPGAGVDIESERSPIRDLAFTRCRFEDNVGAGMVADSGDSADASFRECRFVGTTTWAAWPNKPRFWFEGCEFVGAIVRPFDAADPADGTRFTRCRFRDDPALSPTGVVYGTTCADLGENRNALFEACDFRMTHGSVLPWSTGAVYQDCTMSQRSRAQAFPRGTYLGRNRIDGNVDLYGSRIRGEVLVNGRPVPRS